MSKVQAIVLRHLYLLLGYNQNDKLFQFPPQRLRESAVFNVFLANLPQVLDQNHPMGAHIIPIAIQVLLYAPNISSTVQTAESALTVSYSYSLWYLESHVRRNWLMSVLVILYKYQYTQTSFTDHIQNVIRIVMNTLEAQFHQCRRIPATVVLDIPPRRDLSQPSLGTDQDEREQLSPPASPLYISEGAGSSKGKPGIGKPTASFRKYQDSSLECDDTESELVAIPESDLSDSTLHGSAQGSFDDAMHFDDICAPLKPEMVKSKATAHVTTANLATAHVAMTPLAITERSEERSETIRKMHKLHIVSSGPDRSNNSIIHSTTTTTIEAINSSSIQSKCSISEGVRMMATSSILGTGKSNILFRKQFKPL